MFVTRSTMSRRLSYLQASGFRLAGRLHRNTGHTDSATTNRPKSTISMLLAERTQERQDWLADMLKQRQDWIAIMQKKHQESSAALQKERQGSSALIEKLRGRITEGLLQSYRFERKAMESQVEVQQLKGKFNIKSALEIIAFSVHTRLGHKLNNTDVQNALNAITSGQLDTSGTFSVVYADARADVEARLSSQVPQNSEVDNLYDEFSSKHFYGQLEQTVPIRIHEGDHTAAEVVAVLSIFVFARRLMDFPVDVRHVSSDLTKDFLISELD